MNFKWTDSLGSAGLKRDALYLIRPDGYVALADTAQSIGTLQTYLSRFQIVPRRDAA